MDVLREFTFYEDADRGYEQHAGVQKFGTVSRFLVLNTDCTGDWIFSSNRHANSFFYGGPIDGTFLSCLPERNHPKVLLICSHVAVSICLKSYLLQ